MTTMPILTAQKFTEIEEFGMGKCLSDFLNLTA